MDKSNRNKRAAAYVIVLFMVFQISVPITSFSSDDILPSTGESTHESVTDPAIGHTDDYSDDENVESSDDNHGDNTTGDSIALIDPDFSPILTLPSLSFFDTIDPPAHFFNDIGYAKTPPQGEDINITDRFSFVGNTGSDSRYPNVAVVGDDTAYKYGAIWSNKKLDLNQYFKTEMYLYMAHDTKRGGNLTQDVADGMTFTLHNDSRKKEAIGSDGEGLAAYGSLYYDELRPRRVIDNAVSVEFDLLRNEDRSNPYVTNGNADKDHYVYDPRNEDTSMAHCAVIVPPSPIGYKRIGIDVMGNKVQVKHINSFDFAKRADWVKFAAEWTPNRNSSGVLTGNLTYIFDGQTKSINVTDVQNMFGGDQVYWGFTGSTGLHHSILAAAVTKWPEQPPFKSVSSASGQSGAAVKVGERITYKIDYENYNPVDTDVYLYDDLDPALTFISSSAVCNYDPDQHRVEWDLKNVPPNTRDSLELTVEVNDKAVSKVSNIAYMRVGNGEIKPSEPVENPVNLGLPSKIVSSETGKDNAPLKVDDELTYTIRYINDEAATADIKIKDELPRGVDYVSSSALSTYSGITDHSVEWILKDVPSLQKGTVNVTVKVNESAVSTIENTARVQIGNGTEVSTNNVVNPFDPGRPIKKVVSDTGSGGSEVKIGDSLTYKINYFNNTPSTAGIHVVDYLPKEVEYQSSSAISTYGSISNHAVEWYIPYVPSGGSGNVEVTVIVGEGAVVDIENSAEIKVGDGAVIQTTTTKNPVDRGIPIKEVTSETGQSGSAVKLDDELTYTIHYANDTSQSAMVTIIDELPDGVDYVTSSPIGDYKGPSDHRVAWTLPNVPSGGRGTVEVTVKVNEKAIVQIENQATIQIGSGNPTVTTKANNPIDSGPPVKEVISATGKDGERVKLGDEIVYRINYINHKITDATIKIWDRLSPGFDYVSSSAMGQYNPMPDHLVEWTIDDVPSGYKGAVEVKVRVNDQAVVDVKNYSWIKIDDDVERWSNTTVNPVEPSAPKKIVISNVGLGGAMVERGEQITYSIECTNYTPSTASIRVVDKLPEGVSYISSGAFEEVTTTYSGITGHAVTWELTGVHSGATRFVYVTVEVNDKAIVSITNQADVYVGTHGALQTTKVRNPIAPVTPKKEVVSGPGVGGGKVSVGDELTYAIDYVNYTPTTASIDITDKLPTGTTYVSSSGMESGISTYSGIDDHTVTWKLRDIPSSSGSTVYVKVVVNEDAIVKIENQAEIKVGDNSALFSTKPKNPVDPGHPKKEIVSGSGVNDGEVSIGDELVYSIQYLNYTPSTASITIKDKLPSGTTYVSYSGIDKGVYSYDRDSHTFTATIPGVTSGSIEYIFLKVEVNEDAIVQIENTASIIVGTNSAITSTTPTNPVNPKPPDKKVTSGSGVGGKEVKVGDELTYTIEYANYTSSTASIRVRDVLNKGLTYVTSTGINSTSSYIASEHAIEWLIPDVGSGTRGAVELTVRVNGDALVEITNGAFVYVGTHGAISSVVPRNPVRPEIPEKVVVTGPGLDGGRVDIGEEIVYCIGYTNYTPSEAAVDITDILPSGTTYISSSGVESGISTLSSIGSKPAVKWMIDDVPSGYSGKVYLKVRVNEEAIVQIENQAEVKVGTHEAISSTIPKNPVKPEQPTKEIATGEGISGSAVSVGDELIYRISYGNYTTSEATITIKDTLPSGLTYVTRPGVNVGSTYDEVKRTVTWTIDDVTSGSRGAVELTVRVNEEALVYIENKAEVKVGTHEAITSTVPKNPVNPEPPGKEIVSGAGVSGDAVNVGDELTYKIHYTNYTQSKASIVIDDKLSSGLTYVTSSGVNSTSAYIQGQHSVRWVVDNVDSGTRGFVELTVEVNEHAVVEITNGAIIQVGDNDPISSVVPKNPVNPEPPKKEIATGTGISGDAVSVGDELVYKIHYANYTTATATITIKDKLSKGLSFVTSSGVNSTSSYDPSAREVTWTIDDVKSGSRGAVELTVKVNEDAVVAITNGAMIKVGSHNPISSIVPQNPVNSETPIKEITTGKGIDGGVVEIGDELAYSIGYTNYTPSKAAIAITDILPSGTTYISSSGMESGISTLSSIGGKPAVKWVIDDVPSGYSGKVYLKVRVNEEAIVQIENQAEVKVGTHEAISSTIPINPVKPEQPIKKITTGEGISGSAVSVGDELTYRISYGNYTTSDATITIIDTLPSGLTYVTRPGVNVGSTYDEAKRTVTWTIDDVTSGSRGTVELTVRVNEDALVYVENKAEVKVGTHEAITSTVPKNPVNPVPPDKEIVSGSGISGNAVNVGDELVYKIHYTNYTPSTASIKIVDKLNPGLTFVTSSGVNSTSTYDESTHTVTWTIGDVDSGKSGSVELTVKVNEDAVVEIDNTARVEVGTRSAIETVTPKNPVNPEPPGKEIVSGAGISGDAVNVGDKLTYKIYYTNYIPSKASIVIDDKLSPGLTYVTSSGVNSTSAYIQGQHAVRWVVDNVDSGGRGFVELTVEVNEHAVVEITNGAIIQVGDHAPISSVVPKNPVNPEPPEKVVVTSDAISGSGVAVGDSIVYSIEYTNYTPSIAAILIKDKLPRGTTYISSSGVNSVSTYSGIEGGHTVEWFIKNVASGTSGKVFVRVEVNEEAIVEIENQADVIVGTHDAIHSTVPSTPVKPEPPEKEIATGTGISGNAVSIGDELVYKIHYANYTTSTAAVTIKDKLQPGLSYVTSSGLNSTSKYNESTREVTWTIDDVKSGSRGFVELTVKVNENAVVEITNGAVVIIGNQNPINTVTPQNPVKPKPPEKEVAIGNGIDGEAVSVGDEIVYSIGYTNYTTSDAAVVITDTLPSGTQYISSSGMESGISTLSSINGKPTVTWTIDDVPSGYSGKVYLKVQINEEAIVEIENKAEIKVGTHEAITSTTPKNPIKPEPPKKEIATGTGISGNAVSVGDELVYKIHYANYTTATATITIKDKLSKGLSFVTSSGVNSTSSYDPSAREVTWTIDDVKSGTRGTVELTVQVNEDAVVEITNGAMVKVGSHDPISSLIPKNPVKPETPNKEVMTGSGIDGSPVAIGDEIVYSIEYTNYTTSTASIFIKDKLPSGTRYISSSGINSVSTYSGIGSGHYVDWTVKNVKSGERGKVIVKVEVSKDALVEIENRSTIKVGTHAAINSTVPINPVKPDNPRKEITSGSGISGGAVDVGDELVYTIHYTNYTPSTASIMIKDKLSLGLEFVTSSGLNSKSEYQPNTRTVTWTVGDVPSGTSGTVELTVRVGDDAVVEIENQADVFVGTHEAINTVTPKNPVNPVNPIKKVTGGPGVGGGTVKVGDQITYTIEYANHTPTKASIVITDMIDEGVDFVSCSDNGEYTTNHSLKWTIPDVDSGAKGSVTLTVEVNDKAVGIIDNQATVKVGNETELKSTVPENPVGIEPPIKKVTSETGKDGSLVKAGDVLVYSINYINRTSGAATVTIEDNLPNEVKYLNSSPSGHYNSTPHSIEWTLNSLPSMSKGAVEVAVEVKEGVKTQIENMATVTVGTHSPGDSNKTRNPIDGNNPGPGPGPDPDYRVVYKAGVDDAVILNIPASAEHIKAGTVYTVAGLGEEPTWEDHLFNGWLVTNDSSGKLKKNLKPGETFTMPSNDVELTAQWRDDGPGLNRDDHVSYVIGYIDGTVKPGNDILRSEATTIVFRLLEDDSRKLYWSTTNDFPDVNTEDWCNNAISTMANAGIVNGLPDGRFGHAEPITRAEYATIISRFDTGSYTDSAVFTDIEGHWAENHIKRCAARGWLVGDNGLFRPDDRITRAEVMVFINRVLERVPESPDDLLDTMQRWPDNSDTTSWYYLAVQEATNTHKHKMKANGQNEYWTELLPNPDWAALEREWANPN